MVLGIERDLNRFKEIVRGKVRKDLKKYMSTDELLGKQGKNIVSIPIPEIHVPRFRYGKNDTGGVGQGDGPGQGGQQAGDQPGEHAIEAEVTLEELAEIMGDELALPRIQPRGKREVASHKTRYTGISVIGPESLRHVRRTFRQALKRQMSAGEYDPKNPRIIPIREDRRYRTWTIEEEPQSAAVIFYLMDVSGSMGQEQKDIVRLETFWIDTWIQHNYKNMETRFIIHDASAREVDRHTFFHTRESGGTLISSAYELAMQLIDAHYPPKEWNIYLFHFSDGDNWSTNDTRKCLDLMKLRILPIVNLFGYGQVDSEYGSGQFYKDLKEAFPTDERLVLSRIPDRDAIMGSIKEFLEKGR